MDGAGKWLRVNQFKKQFKNHTDNSKEYFYTILIEDALYLIIVLIAFTILQLRVKEETTIDTSS
jgi:hypothetical protein